MRVLATTLIIILLPLAMTKQETWELIGVDQAELPEDSFLDLRGVYIKIEEGKMFMKLTFGSNIPQNGSVIAGILLDTDMNPYTGARHKSGFGIDYSLMLEVSSERKSIQITPWNDTIGTWDIKNTRKIDANAIISGDSVEFELPRETWKEGNHMIMILRTTNAYFERIDKAFVYNYTENNKISIDGLPDDWIAEPVLSTNERPNFPCIDGFKSVYFTNDKYFLYTRVDTWLKPLNYTLGGVLYRRFQFYIDKDLNSSTGENRGGLGLDYAVILSFTANLTEKSALAAVLKWNPEYKWLYHYSSPHLIWYDEVMEAGLGLGVLEAETGKPQGFFVEGLITQFQDDFKDGNPIIIPRAVPLLSDLNLEAKSEVDYNMCFNYSCDFKTFSMEPLEKPVVKLGGPLIYPEEWSGHDANFTVEDGRYVGIGYFGEVLYTDYGKIDYCIISVVECGGNAEILVGGVTRYGTLAGLIWLMDNIDIILCMDYMVEWHDNNGDGRVTGDEVSLIWYGGG